MKANNIIKLLKTLKSLKVLIVGDAIVDEYSYCEPLGKSSAGPLVVHKHLSTERFAGGALMVANNVAGLCGEVRLVTMLGGNKSMEGFVRNKLSGVQSSFIYRKGTTTLKTRFVDPYLNQVLFQVNRLEEGPMLKEFETDILRRMETWIPKVDLVMICDYGHDLITTKIIHLLELEVDSFVLAVNVQTNSANVGYNTITKYRRADFVCLNDVEARLACQDRYGDMGGILKKLATRLETRQLIVTRGSKGCVSFASDMRLHESPALCETAVDRLGAGDAFFAFAAPCFAAGLPPDVVSFVGNAAGALAAQIVGNRGPVEPEKLFEFIRRIK